MIKHILSITDLTAKEIWQIFSVAKGSKKNIHSNALKNKTMVMLFEKPSLRTKLSFDIGFSQLGGHSVYFGPGEVGLGKRESIADVAKVITSMADLIVARVFNHEHLEELAKYSKAPVINALSDLEHPCQAMTDFFTVWESKGKLKGLTISYVGDGENNVAHSLCLGSAMLGINFRCASPEGYFLNKQVVQKAKEMGGNILETEDPKTAVLGADVVATDTWVSMGDSDKERRMKLFRPYQVNEKLMQFAKKNAVFLHCLPAHRGDEVSANVIDGPKSRVFQEAENRLHVQKALLIHIWGFTKAKTSGNLLP